MIGQEHLPVEVEVIEQGEESYRKGEEELVPC
jgi:hypothetical protein